MGNHFDSTSILVTRSYERGSWHRNERSDRTLRTELLAVLGAEFWLILLLSKVRATACHPRVSRNKHVGTWFGTWPVDGDRDRSMCLSGGTTPVHVLGSNLRILIDNRFNMIEPSQEDPSVPFVGIHPASCPKPANCLPEYVEASQRCFLLPSHQPRFSWLHRLHLVESLGSPRPETQDTRRFGRWQANHRKSCVVESSYIRLAELGETLHHVRFARKWPRTW